MKSRFSARQHFPLYTKVLLKTIRNPALMYFIIVGNFLLACSILIFFHAEHGNNPDVKTYWDAVWWGFTTITTVGYGDVVPVTIQGRIVSILLMVIGVSFFASFTALFVTTFVRLDTAETERELNLVFEKLNSLEQKLDTLLHNKN